MSAHNFKDLTGQLFNSWKVLNVSHTANKIVYYRCVCLECNEEHTVDGRNIRSGRSRRCTKCGHKHTSNANRGIVRSKYTPKGSSFRRLYSNYKKGAKSKKRVFKLDFEFFRELTQENCHYCGITPSAPFNGNINTRCSEQRTEAGWIKYNGVDRVDSSKGYLKSNVVACCDMCNYAKRHHGVEHFKIWLKRAYKHNFKKEK